MSLRSADKKLIRAIDIKDVDLTLASLKPFLGRRIWLGSSNRYLRKAVDRLRSDGGNLGGTKSRHLAQYISASSVLHCNDAWSYMARALHAAMSGDPHRALHLAYYAELRAAMSLLAASGIGIFNNKHYIITAPLTSAKLTTKDRTHELAWDALAYWGEGRTSGELFSNLVKPGGVSLSDWLFPIGGSSAVSAQASAWFLQWGQDLKWGAKDRNLRNESSYRPDGLPDPWSPDPSYCLSFVRDFWNAFEPTAGSLFGVLDQHILRLILEKSYTASTGHTATGPLFLVYVQRVLANQTFPSAVRLRWEQFLTRAIEPTDNELLVKARIKPTGSKPDELAVVSRAALLLRLSTGSVSDLLHEAGITVNETGFWWEAIGAARGFWSHGAAPDPLTDLWADVKTALDDLEAFQGRHAVPQQTAFRLVTELAPALPVLSSAERIGLWSLHAA